MRTIALRLDADTRRKLEIIAQATGCQHELLVAEAVRRFVDAELAALLAMQENASQAPSATSSEKARPLPENWKIIV